MVKRKQGLVPVPRLGIHNKKGTKPESRPGPGSQVRENPKAQKSPTGRNPNASHAGGTRGEEGAEGRKTGTGPGAGGERAGNKVEKRTHTPTGKGSLEGGIRQQSEARRTQGEGEVEGKSGRGVADPKGRGESARGGEDRRGHRARQNQRIYRQAATALTRCLAADASKRGGASLKSLTLAPQNVAKKATHALTCQTLKLLPLLQLVLAMAGILEAPAGERGGLGSGRGSRGGRGGARARGRGRGRGGTGVAGEGVGKGLWAELVYVVAYDVLFGNPQAAAAAFGGHLAEASPGHSGGGKNGKEGSAAAAAASGSSKGRGTQGTQRGAMGGTQSPEVRAVLTRRSALQAALARLVVREGVPSVDQLVLRLCGPGAVAGAGGWAGAGAGAGGEGQQGGGALAAGAFPRYARVNTLKTSLAEALRALSDGVHPGATPRAQEGSLSEVPAEEATSGPGGDEGKDEEGREGEGAGGSEGAGQGEQAQEMFETKGGDMQQDQHKDGNGHVQQSVPGASRGESAPQSAPGAPEEDPLIPNVLRFPPGADLHAHPLVRRGHLILQGRASCIPAHVLAPAPGAHVLDACAAPGNKTTHLTAVMGGRGKVTACERDPQRAQLLRSSVERAGAGGVVEVVVGDFLSLDPLEERFADVAAVLVDPSCSGSGTAVSRMDHLLPSSRRQAMAAGKAHAQSAVHAPSQAAAQGGEETEGEEGAEGEGSRERDSDKGGSGEGIGQGAGQGTGQGVEQAVGHGPEDPQQRARLEGLARFQEAALRHALGFPGVRRVVYSTCSVEERENEGVVARVLGRAADLGFQLAPALPGWPRRGLRKYEFADMVLRTQPEEDLMDGFFVALFTRDLQKQGQEGAGVETGQGPALDGGGVAGEGNGAQGKKRRKKKGKMGQQEGVA